MKHLLKLSVEAQKNLNMLCHPHLDNETGNPVMMKNFLQVVRRASVELKKQGIALVFQKETTFFPKHVVPKKPSMLLRMSNDRHYWPPKKDMGYTWPDEHRTSILLINFVTPGKEDDLPLGHLIVNTLVWAGMPLWRIRWSELSIECIQIILPGHRDELKCCKNHGAIHRDMNRDYYSQEIHGVPTGWL